MYSASSTLTWGFRLSLLLGSILQLIKLSNQTSQRKKDLSRSFSLVISLTFIFHLLAAKGPNEQASLHSRNPSHVAAVSRSKFFCSNSPGSAFSTAMVQSCPAPIENISAKEPWLTASPRLPSEFI
jgi:uncharacterized membrane protein